MKRALTQRAYRKVIPTFLDMLAELKQSLSFRQACVTKDSAVV